jgi:hypothetical protein
MKKSVFAGILGFFLVIFIAAGTRAQSANLGGRVQGAGGDPKAYASIQLTGPKTYNSITDPRGNFALNEVEPGSYLVTVVDRNRVQKFRVKVDANTTSLPLHVGW